MEQQGSEWQVGSEAARALHSTECPPKVLMRRHLSTEEPLGMKGPKPLFLTDEQIVARKG